MPTPEELGRVMISMTIDDAEHYTPEQRAQIIASYPEHQRKARAYGIPMMGEGQIYPVDEAMLKEAPFEIPAEWPRIAGIDFGATHPTAVVWLAWNRETDVIHAYDCYRATGGNNMLPIHAAAIKARGEWIPVAWPHDGDNATAAGDPLKEQYRAQKVNMLPERATHKVGGNSVEAGVQDLYTRMITGRFKVFHTLEPLFEELRLYHRKDGRIVKVDDDALDATRYANMMLRKAITKPVMSRSYDMQAHQPRDSITGI